MVLDLEHLVDENIDLGFVALQAFLTSLAIAPKALVWYTYLESVSQQRQHRLVIKHGVSNTDLPNLPSQFWTDALHQVGDEETFPCAAISSHGQRTKLTDL